MPKYHFVYIDLPLCSLSALDGVTRQFVIYKNTNEAKDFRSYHERLQTFLLWFVDAASYIDVDDDKWTFYLMWV